MLSLAYFIPSIPGLRQGLKGPPAHELARSSDEPPVRAENYARFQEELAKDPAFAFICYIDADYVADASIEGISPDTVMGHHGVGIFWNIAEWTK